MNEGELVSQIAAPPRYTCVHIHHVHVCLIIFSLSLSPNSAAVHQVTTYRQLDSDLAKHASLFTMVSKICNIFNTDHSACSAVIFCNFLQSQFFMIVLLNFYAFI